MVHEPELDRILLDCQARLAKEAGVQVSISPLKHASEDLELYKVRFSTTPAIELPALLRRHGELTKSDVHHLGLTSEALLRTLPKLSHKAVMLFAPWVSPPLAELLRERGIFYADTVGNAYVSVDRPRMLLNIQGCRPVSRRKTTGRLIEPSGLKVIHQFLNDPESLTLPYRTLAPRAGVSYATVGIVRRALARAAFLSTNRKRLENVPSLVDHFVRGYALKLRPEIFMGTYRHRTKEIGALEARLKEVLGAAGGRWAFTGGYAAGLLTKYLQTDQIALMVDETSEAALRKEPMLPDTLAGNVVLFRLFAPSAIARSSASAPAPTATPLLVYAELLHDGRARELETAEMLRPDLLPVETGRAF